MGKYVIAWLLGASSDPVVPSIAGTRQGKVAAAGTGGRRRQWPWSSSEV
jgi:hypothetical protein